MCCTQIMNIVRIHVIIWMCLAQGCGFTWNPLRQTNIASKPRRKHKGLKWSRFKNFGTSDAHMLMAVLCWHEHWRDARVVSCHADSIGTHIHIYFSRRTKHTKYPQTLVHVCTYTIHYIHTNPVHVHNNQRGASSSWRQSPKMAHCFWCIIKIILFLELWPYLGGGEMAVLRSSSQWWSALVVS
jgi:hypothetical protein